MNWMLMPLRRYAEFSGRSRRKEYWMYALFLIIAGLVAMMIDSLLGVRVGLGYGPVYALLWLATLVPSIAVTVRRLHDTNRSGWWLLIAFIPIIGAVVLLVFMVLEGTPGSNRFGEDPKGAVDAQVFA